MPCPCVQSVHTAYICPHATYIRTVHMPLQTPDVSKMWSSLWILSRPSHYLYFQKLIQRRPQTCETTETIGKCMNETGLVTICSYLHCDKKSKRKKSKNKFYKNKPSHTLCPTAKHTQVCLAGKSSDRGVTSSHRHGYTDPRQNLHMEFYPLTQMEIYFARNFNKLDVLPSQCRTKPKDEVFRPKGFK